MNDGWLKCQWVQLQKIDELCSFHQDLIPDLVPSIFSFNPELEIIALGSFQVEDESRTRLAASLLCTAKSLDHFKRECH